MATTGKRTIVDGKGHVVGRLAAYVAKQAIEGAEVVVLRAEGTVFSHPLDRAVAIYKDKKNKRCLVNPKKGPFHYKEPSRCLKRVIRGMIDYKRPMGAEAFARIQVFDGIPMEYEKVPRGLLTHALVETQINPVTKTCTLGQVCTKMGWNHQGILEKFEEQRIAREKKVQMAITQKENEKKALIASKQFEKEVAEALAKIE